MMTSNGIPMTIALTCQPCAPCGTWRWTAVVRLRGFKAATLNATSDGSFTIAEGFVPSSEHILISGEIRTMARANELAYFGAGNI